MEDRHENKQIEQNNEALIQEMLARVKPEEIPSELSKNPVIHKGDETLPAPMVVVKSSSAGYVYVWETDTGEKVPILYYMLSQKLRQKLPNGKYRFTTVDPGIRPHRGTIRCLLHEKSLDRQHYNELGFRVCRKENITNKYQLDQHMKKRHPQEWAAIEDERKQKEREEDRALQRAILANQLEKLEMKTGEKPKDTFICDTCGADFGAQKTLDKHKENHK